MFPSFPSLLVPVVVDGLPLSPFRADVQGPQSFLGKTQVKGVASAHAIKKFMECENEFSQRPCL
jgi:hypothetical protein